LFFRLDVINDRRLADAPDLKAKAFAGTYWWTGDLARRLDTGLVQLI